MEENVVTAVAEKEQKSWVMALLLSFFLGALGVHRFYLGYNKTGIALLVLTIASPVTLFITFFIAAVWALVDFIRIIIGSMKEADGTELKK